MEKAKPLRKLWVRILLAVGICAADLLLGAGYLYWRKEQGILFRWRSHANLLFSNWLNYYLYQATPYNLDDLRDGKEDAWREAFTDEKVEI